MTWRVWFSLVSLSVLWGGSFFFAKVALGSFGPLTIVFDRVALAALALNLINPRAAMRRGGLSSPWAH